MEKKIILVTGKNGFIAKNIIEYCTQRKYKVLSVSHSDDLVLLEEYCKQCDIVFHTAAVQRTSCSADFYEGNVEYTSKLINGLAKSDKKIQIFFTTSIGIDKPSDFATTKLEAEKMLRSFSEESNVELYVYKLNNIFGKYGKPNFNNVVATYCYNVANGLPLLVNDPSAMIPFTYVEDLMIDFENCLNGKVDNNYYIKPSVIIKKTLGDVVKILGDIKNCTYANQDFEIKMKHTYDSYLTENE